MRRIRPVRKARSMLWRHGPGVLVGSLGADFLRGAEISAPCPPMALPLAWAESG